MSGVRVRFAPSPTGYLHIGGARTALYNWLYVRRLGGTFVLRVEDTDVVRNTEESVSAIFESMRWLGLDWDEGPESGGSSGPYFQSQRLDIYREHADKLLASGHAYRCYATKEEIDAARAKHAEATGSTKGFRFRSPYRDGEKRAPEGRAEAYVVRFRAPSSGSVVWEDLVKGRIEMANQELQDFVLLRGNGMPLYNFSCAVDDLNMGITLVARGDDHMINTPPQILLYEALGGEVPAFAHLPMILAPNGEKLSKRHAAVSVLEYRDMGYLPDAVLNYLARIGWSHGDQEIFTREELIEKFDFAQVGRTGGKYDAKKFAYVQAEHLRKQSDRDTAGLVRSILVDRGLDVAEDDTRLERAVGPVKLRATSLVDVADGVDYFFREPPAMDDKAKQKFLTRDRAERLRALAEIVGAVSPFSNDALEQRVTAWLNDQGLAMKDVAQPARVALTGRSQSPGLFEVMEILGREGVLARLERAAQLAAGEGAAIA